MRVEPLLPQGMHNICILPLCQVQEDPWRGDEALNPLLRPTRQTRNERWLPRMSPGGLGLCAG